MRYVPSSGTGAVTATVVVGALGTADPLVGGRATSVAVVFVLRPITMPTANRPANSNTATAPTRIRRGRRLVGLAGALVAVEKLSRRRASTPAADCSIEPRRWGVGAAGAGEEAYVVDYPAYGWPEAVDCKEPSPRALISDRDAGLFVHRVGELAAAAEPVRGRCGERTREDTVEACQVRAEGGELRWLQRSGVRTINRRRTGEQVYGGKRQRVLIGTPVNVGPRRQFGRRIAGLAGNSEVGQQDPLVASTLTG